MKISAIKTTFLGDNRPLPHRHLKARYPIAPKPLMRNLDALSILIGDKGYDDQGFHLALRQEEATYKAQGIQILG